MKAVDGHRGVKLRFRIVVEERFQIDIIFLLSDESIDFRELFLK